MGSHILSSRHRETLKGGLAAVAAGVLVGAAFPPTDQSWLVWVGLVPLFWALRRRSTGWQAFGSGFLAGLACFLLAARPLASAHAWAGWAGLSAAELSSMLSRQWWFLHGLWIAVALWIALFWGAFGVVLHWLAGRLPRSYLMAAPCLWILIPEWLRSGTTWGFQWSYLGNALADYDRMRQLAAVGGVWLLSALVVAVNGVFFATLVHSRHKRFWLTPLLAGLVVTVVWIWGSTRQRAVRSQDRQIQVVALQHHRERYTQRDFLSFGLDRSYLQLSRLTVQENPDLLMLPESIARGAVSLDSSLSIAKPRGQQISLADWSTPMRSLLAGSKTVIVMGLDTVEQGKTHNSLVAWSADGPLGWYHKQRLVPFSEYTPRIWGRWAIRGTSGYSVGIGSNLIRAPKFTLGGFVCQEVLFPSVTRRSVQDGASLLISGGNDGVFADSAVAKVHADLTQIRAVETGRYVVRAMKTGISAIVDPSGREIVRSPSSEPVILRARVASLTGLTPYVRFGDWPLVVAFLVVTAVVVIRVLPGKTPGAR